MKNLIFYLLVVVLCHHAQSQGNATRNLSGIYYIDRFLVNSMQSMESLPLKTTEIDVLQKQYVEKFEANIPEYIKHQNIRSLTNVDYVGISSPFNRDEIPDIIEVIGSRRFEIALEEKSNELEADLTKARGLIIEEIGKLSIPDSLITGLTDELAGIPGDQFFDISADGINTVLDARVKGKLETELGDEFESIHKVINTNVGQINEKIEDFGKGYQLLVEFKFAQFGSLQTIRTEVEKNLQDYERIKNTSPVEAIKLLKQNEIFLGLVDNNHLGKIETIATEVENVISSIEDIENIAGEVEKGWNEIQKLVNGDLDIAKLELANLTGKSFDDFFINQTHKELSAKYMYYSTIGIFDGPLRDAFGFTSEDIYEAYEIVGDVGLGVGQLYAGDFLGGISSIASGISSLFGGGRKKKRSGNVALANMMAKGFNQVFENQKRIMQNQQTIIKNQAAIVKNQEQISEQINDMHRQMIENDQITWELIDNLHKQIMKNDSMIVSILSEIDSKVVKLHRELREFHIYTVGEIETIQQKLNFLINQNNCISSAIQEASLEAFQCRGIMENDLIEATVDGRLNSLDDYGEYYVPECIKGLRDLPNTSNPATLSLDYNKCFDNVSLSDIRLSDYKSHFAMLRDLWNSKYGSTYNREAAYVALLNPSKEIAGNNDIEIARKLRRADASWYNREDLLNTVDAINDMDPDALNNMNAIIDITKYYLYALPMMAKSGSLGEELIDPDEYGAYLKLRVVTNAVNYYKRLLEITIAQQSLFSGTMVLGHIRSKISSSNISADEKMKWIYALKYNQYLVFNFAKYLKSRNDSHLIPLGKDFQAVIDKNSFRIQRLDQDDPVTEIEIRGEEAMVIINSPERVLPRGYYEMIDIHKKYLILSAELETINDLDKNNLFALKKIYLN